MKFQKHDIKTLEVLIYGLLNDICTEPHKPQIRTLPRVCTEAKDGEEKLKSTKVNAQSTSVETGKTKKKKKPDTKKHIRPKFHRQFGSGP